MESDLSKMQVLIVDDSRIIRKAVHKAVTQAGVEEGCIREAGDGLEALAALETSLPDIIFLDVHMPNMNGEEFMEVVGTDGRSEKFAVVIVSTEMNAKRLLKLAQLGARTRLHKPFAPERIREIMMEICNAA